MTVCVRGVVSISVVLASAASLCAQINDPAVSLTNIEPLPAKTPLLEYALAAVFLLASMAIGILPSYRVKKAKLPPRAVGRGGPL